MPHDALVEHCIELLAPLGRVRTRRMFGGHGFYVDDVFVALIAFEQFFVKTDAASRPQFEAAGCRPFVFESAAKPPTVTSYFTVPAEAMESPALMQPWARLALQAALAARAAKKPVKPRRARRASAGGR
jgi:DNA transformation protein and related proteins